MNFQDRFLKGQIELIKPIANGATLDTVRGLQDKIGKLMHFARRKDVVAMDGEADGCRFSVIIPRDELRGGIILYLHGGGYTCGAIDYAKGFASTLCCECGMRVKCIEYRLAPENPYPAALDDALAAYKSLIEEGYPAEKIILAGESAGGGLAFSLAIKLREEGEPKPAGIIAISPWCDLTLSGESYETNKDKDPSLTRERLKFFADCYVGNKKDAKKQKKKAQSESDNVNEHLKSDSLVSPLFANLEGLPPTLIFAGADEILLSDAERMASRLTEFGCNVTLTVRQGMWHAYLLYGLKSSKSDFASINSFVKRVMPKGNERKLRWMRLDNSAKIYPAAATRRWNNVFRLSATLKDEYADIDREVLQSALDVTVRRFPSIAVRLRRGTFWYYLEEIAHAPKVQDERGCPLMHMPFDDIRNCAFRVLVYKGRIAVEFFHALTDGNGGLVFMKTLLAEYLSEKYGEIINEGDGVLDRLEEPKEYELQDCFPKHKAPIGKSRSDNDSYRITGTPEADGFRHNTAFTMNADELRRLASEHGVTVTALLTAAIIRASILLQNEDTRSLRKQKAVKVLIPVDLRRIYGERTLRNFVLYVTPGVDPRLGEYSFSELCGIVKDIMELEITKKNMSARIYTNVHDEEINLLKLTPLFLKNIVMKAVFRLVGERKSTLTLSNLGVIKVPEQMRSYIKHFDFVLGVQSSAPYNAGLVSYDGVTRLNIIRNIEEPRLEMSLYLVLRELGIHVKAEANEKPVKRRKSYISLDSLD